MSTMNRSNLIRPEQTSARILFWTSALVVVLLALTTVVALAFTQSQFISFTLEGCRFFAGLTLPDTLGRYICPDSEYTTGNLAKGWNELDLVPHRLITDAGNQGGTTTDFSVYIAADYQTGGRTGYDVISVPVVNTVLSDASCTVSAGSQSTQGSSASPFGGGTDVVIYRELTIHQAKGTTCVFDYYQRLALGAHLYPGSSLQSYMFEQAGLSGSKKTISIPVNEILPQSINKDMTASQAAAYTWTITKSPSPANLSFSDTCDARQPKSQGVQITVSWEKLAATPGKISAITHIYATNPSARVVTVEVTDQIYNGSTPIENSASSGAVNVPANTTNFLLLTHKQELDPGPTSLNDVATATYADLVTGFPVPGNTTATASAPVQMTYTNASAVIDDLESITGAGLSYSADSFEPFTGNFDGGYVPGTKTSGQISWTSASQSGNNSITFNKTVYVVGPSQVSGNLHDIATLTGSDGFTASNTADVAISTDARVSLTIQKNIDRVLLTDQTFTFKVKDPGSIMIATPSITILAGQVSGSTTVNDLLPGVVYTVSEDPRIGWVAGPEQTTTVNLPSCSGEVNFSNISAQDLTVSKTIAAAFNRAYSWDIYKNVDKTRVDIAEGSLATFNYTVGVTHDTGTDSDWTVSGQITVNNPNGFDVAGVNITDAIDHGGTCTVTSGTGLTVPANGSMTRSYSCTFTTAPGSGTNTATATWNASTYNTPSGSASGPRGYDFSTVVPSITAGSVTVNDTLGGALGTVSYTDPSPKEFSYSHSFAGIASTCTDYENTVTILETKDFAKQNVKVCVGKDLTVNKTASASYNRTYQWLIDKNVDDTRIEIAEGGKATFNYSVKVTPDGYTDSGFALGGSITITNPNDWEEVTVNVNDTLDQGGTCLITEAAPHDVPKSGSLTLHYTCTTDGTTTKNTAAVTWDKTLYATPNGSASKTVNVSFNLSGDTHETITVIDDKTDPQNPVALGTWNWADGEHTFTYSLEKTGVAGTCTPYTNTAKIDETGQSGSQTVTVCVGKDLNVTKTVDPRFIRTYLWQIVKGVDKNLATMPGGGTATFNYTVDVTQTGLTDSAWMLFGKITITNPNDWEDITLSSLVDSVATGWDCSVPVTTQKVYYLSRKTVMLPVLVNRGLGAVAPKGPVSVPQAAASPAADLGPVIHADSSVELDYTCSWAGTGSPGNGTNTATVTWDKDQYFTPTGTAYGEKSFTFTTPNTAVNKTVTITDLFNGSLTTLGTVTATDEEPFASKTFAYPRNIPVSFGCKDYPNTATIIETNQSDDQLVTVCGPTQTGAHTIGFWQNKNGQGIIKTAGEVGGVCKPTPWLRQYAPYQDLSATASCTQAATYVYNVIKAASAGGMAMNPMLKAQMLATTLDVYFSDPALGGNQLQAPAPIGGLTVDLTKVCSEITYGCMTEDASSAFGGVKNLTVSQLLAYAASQSNAGGSLWYGNVKVIQELAKDTFDAINNQVTVEP